MTVNILMKTGLLLLGVYLNLLRINNYPNIFPSIAFHGGIVGYIFLTKYVFPLSHGAKRQSCNAIETALAGIAIRCLLSLLYREKRETVWSGTGTTVYAWKPRASGKPEPTLSTWLAGNRGTREPR